MQPHPAPRARHRARATARLALPALALLLTACASGPSISLDEPIEGPTWRLALIGQPLAAPAGDPMRNPQLRFDHGSLGGNGGCNQLSARYQRQHSQLRIEALSATRAACADPSRGQLESDFFQALQATASYRLQDGGRLALLDAGGRTLLVMVQGGATAP